MRLSRHTISGMTLLEVLLVLVIGGSLFIYGLHLYNSVRADADTLDLKYNIDALFRGAADYYYANCGLTGALSPTTASPVNSVTPTILITGGFLSPNFPKYNPLVDSSAPDGGYAIQFTKYTSPRLQSACADPTDCAGSQTMMQIGTVVIWQIQISLTMLNASLAEMSNAAALLNATSFLGNQLVFLRLPAALSSDDRAESSYLAFYPAMKTFNLLYTTNPMSDLLNQSHSTEYQYFYCGG